MTTLLVRIYAVENHLVVSDMDKYQKRFVPENVRLFEHAELEYVR